MKKQIFLKSAFILFLVTSITVWLLTLNSLERSEKQVVMSWTHVQSNYQRRSELIPVLLASLRRYLAHEREISGEMTKENSPQRYMVKKNLNRLYYENEKSTEVRKSLSAKPPANQLKLKQLGEIEKKIGMSMHKLIEVVETYPKIRSSEKFVTFQAQFEDTEKRIDAASMRFNESVLSFNDSIRHFPGSLVARVIGFKRMDYFKSDAELDKTVNWNLNN